MTTTRLMGSVFGMHREPAEDIAKTVELTASQSSSRPADFPPEIYRPTKPEVAPKPVITRQPSVLAPLSQMWADDKSWFQLPAEFPGMSELGQCTANLSPFQLVTGNGNGNQDDVSIQVGEGVQAYTLCMTAVKKHRQNYVDRSSQALQ